MQDLEDRAADRFFARHALHAGLALAVPGLDAILAVDHVEADRQRVDDLLGEPPLLLDLARARRHFRLEPVRVFGVAQRRSEQVGDGRDEDRVLAGERAARPHGERAELLSSGQETHRDESVAGALAAVRELLGDRLGGRVVLRDRPGAPKAVEAAEPEGGLGAVELRRDRGQHAGDRPHRPNHRSRWLLRSRPARSGRAERESKVGVFRAARGSAHPEPTNSESERTEMKRTQRRSGRGRRDKMTERTG